MSSKTIWVALLLTLAGCAAQPADAGKAPDSVAGDKADCASQDACDNASSTSALMELGLDRFFAVGDSWTVAWVYKNDDSIHRDGVQQIGNATYHAPRLIAYDVVDVSDARFGRVTRRTATVAVAAQIDAPPSIQTLVGAPFEGVDERIDYTINDLFNPVAKTFYALDALGRTVSTTVDLDGRSNLTMQFDTLPNGYPNLDRITPAVACNDVFFARLDDPESRPFTACWGDAPTLPIELAEIAAAAGVSAGSRGLHIAPTDAQPDYMFWQTGKPHPTYVSGPRGYGLLIASDAR